MDDMTILQWQQSFVAREPEFFIVASDHTFDCICEPCIAFLIDGLESVDPEEADEWILLREENWADSEEQRQEIQSVAAELL